MLANHTGRTPCGVRWRGRLGAVGRPSSVCGGISRGNRVSSSTSKWRARGEALVEGVLGQGCRRVPGDPEIRSVGAAQIMQGLVRCWNNRQGRLRH